jgi:hypothetical protein
MGHFYPSIYCNNVQSIEARETKYVFRSELSTCYGLCC